MELFACVITDKEARVISYGVSAENYLVGIAFSLRTISVSAGRQ